MIENIRTRFSEISEAVNIPAVMLMGGGISSMVYGSINSDYRFVIGGAIALIAPTILIGGYRMYASIAKPTKMEREGDVYFPAKDREIKINNLENKL